MDNSALSKLRELVRLKQLRAAVIAAEGLPVQAQINAAGHKVSVLSEKIQELSEETQEKEQFQKSVILNLKQQEFVDFLVSGDPIALTGPAGSGKTTSVKEAIKKLLSSGLIPPIQDCVHKHINNGTPGVVCVAFTNKAVNNMKKVLPKDLRGNCITIHKLLEFQPEYFETLDMETGNMKKSMQFMPARHAGNPLPKGIKVLVIDEATMVAVDLWNLVADAIAHKIQIILIGDIQQLPPVFGKPIFIYAMQQGIKTVELTEVHRQALESPIISLAHKILEGKQIPLGALEGLNHNSEHGKMVIKPWKKKLSDTGALKILGMFLPELVDKGEYDPLNDVILTCFNVNFGTQEINNIVASHLAKKKREALESLQRGDFETVHQLTAKIEELTAMAKVYEILAGIKKKYFRIGDKVLYNKTEHFITAIRKNPKYFGKLPRMESTSLDYYGIESDSALAFSQDAGTLTGKTDDEIDDFLASFARLSPEEESEKEGMKRASSHILEIYSEELDQNITLDTSGEVGGLELGYAITVHKSQGSEWNRVFFISHESQASMHFRELVYTAITRAKKELYVICPPAMFVKGVNTQRLPGKTLADKLVAFDRQMQIQKGRSAEQPMRLDLFQPKAEMQEFDSRFQVQKEGVI